MAAEWGVASARWLLSGVWPVVAAEDRSALNDGRSGGGSPAMAVRHSRHNPRNSGPEKGE